MTAKEIRKLGHEAIIKENRSHQEVFDELSQKEGIDRELLAFELSKIPSNGKQKSSAVLRYFLIAFLLFIALLRIASIILIRMEGRVDLLFLIFLLLIILIVPALGIYATLFHKVELYKTTGFLLILSLFQSIRRGELVIEQKSLIVIIPFIVGAFLAFYIPSRLKTPYKTTTTEKFVDGQLVKTTKYVFENTRIDESGLLDAEL